MKSFPQKIKTNCLKIDLLDAIKEYTFSENEAKNSNLLYAVCKNPLQGYSEKNRNTADAPRYIFPSFVINARDKE